MIPAGLGDLGADLGVELLGGEGLGILGGIDGRGGAGLAAAAIREPLEEPLDLGPESLVERVAGRCDLGEEVPGTLSIPLADGLEGFIVESQGPALLGHADLSDQLVGLGVNSGLGGLGLPGRLAGRPVVAAGIQGLGLGHELLAAVPGRRLCGRLGLRLAGDRCRGLGGWTAGEFAGGVVGRGIRGGVVGRGCEVRSAFRGSADPLHRRV